MMRWVSAVALTALFIGGAVALLVAKRVPR